MDLGKSIIQLLVNLIPVISVVYVAAGGRLFKHKGEDTVNYFSLLLFACALYSFGYYLELNSNSFEAMLIFRNIEYIGVVLVPSFGLLFIADICNYKYNYKVSLPLLMLSLILWLLFITDPFHNLMYTSIDIYYGLYSVPMTDKGPLFYLIIAYYGVFLISSSIMLYYSYNKASNRYRRRSLRFLLGAFTVPWVALLFIVLGFDKYVDPTPIMIMIMCALFLVNNYKNNMLELEIKRWEGSFNDFNQPAFLVDTLREIVNYNKEASIIVNGSPQYKGEFVDMLEDAEIDNIPLKLEVNSYTMWYYVKRNYYDIKRRYFNYFLVDITSSKDAEEALKESEERYKTLSNVTMEGIVIHRNGVVIDANKSLEKLLGVTREEMINTNVLDFVVEEDKEIVINSIKRQYVKPYKVRVRKSSGEIFVAELEARNFMMKGEVYRVGAIRDVTERDRAQIELAETKDFLELLLESIPIPVFYKDKEGKYLGFNKAFEEFFGKSKEELVGKSVFDINPEELAKIYHAKDKELFDKIGRQVYDSNVQDFKGNLHNVIFNKASMTNREGEITGLIGAILDITERKIAEKNLKDSEEKFRLLITQMSQGLAVHAVVLDDDNHVIDYVFVDANKAFEEMTGLRREEIIGKSVLDLFPETEDYWIKTYGEVAMTGISTIYENYSKEMDRHYQVIAYSPQQGQFATISNDITDRKQLEERIRQEKILLETTLLSVGDGVISTNNNCKIMFMNKVAETLTGFTQEEAIGKNINEIFNIIDEKTRAKSEDIVAKVLSTGKTYELASNTLLISKDGIERPVEDSAAPIIRDNGEIQGVVLVFRDYTEKKIKQDEIKYLSYHDQLTGLYNRRYYEETLPRIDIEDNLPLTLVMGDVNGLKLVNDSFGHKLGDELLIKTTKVIAGGLRAGDILARLGGDEFIILMPKTTSDKAEKIIRQIKNNAAKEKVGSVDVSISFGYETKQSKDQDIQDIFIKAEDRMYRHKLSESNSMRSKTIDLIMKTLYEKSGREMLHSERVGKLCYELATELGYDKDIVNKIKIAGLMHDIGKVEIDKELLNKDKKLTKEEMLEVRRHPEIGFRILDAVKEFNEIADYVLAHHERYDGKGYPKGLKGEEIPFEARIITIADAYDAMTSERSYNQATTKTDAIQRIKKASGTHFDPKIAKVFIQMLEKDKSL